MPRYLSCFDACSLQSIANHRNVCSRISMAHQGFEHLWKQADLSDAEIMVLANHQRHAGVKAVTAQDSTGALLQQFPGHSQILTLSPYLAALVRWQSQSPPNPQGSSCCSPGASQSQQQGASQSQQQGASQSKQQGIRQQAIARSWFASMIIWCWSCIISIATRCLPRFLMAWLQRRSQSSPQLQGSSQPPSPSQQASKAEPRPQESSQPGSSSQQPKIQLHITLPDASFEPAAMAVLAGLYQVKPWPELLSDLEPQQQVQAAVLADMWQLTAGSQACLEVLHAAADTTDGLSAVLEGLLSLEAVPVCMQPLFERGLLSKFGDLEAVWTPGNTSLQWSLLALPLHAMEVLLASDKLKVASEDTVLFTAQTYIDEEEEAGYFRWKRFPTKLAVEKLAPLVRCTHLSQFWLSAAVLADSAGEQLLQGLQPQLKRLMSLRQVYCEGVPASAVRFSVADRPASWLLPVRDIQPRSSAQLEWEVDVAAIRRTAQEGDSTGYPVDLSSPNSCLLAGFAWQMLLCYHPSSSTLGLRARARNLPYGAYCRCTLSLECLGVDAMDTIDTMVRSTCPCFVGVHGKMDFFKLRTMPGAFDEVWAAKGLPTSGSIVLRLTVEDVGVGPVGISSGPTPAAAAAVAAMDAPRFEWAWRAAG